MSQSSPDSELIAQAVADVMADGLVKSEASKDGVQQNLDLLASHYALVRAAHDPTDKSA